MERKDEEESEKPLSNGDDELVSERMVVCFVNSEPPKSLLEGGGLPRQAAADTNSKLAVRIIERSSKARRKL